MLGTLYISQTIARQRQEQMRSDRRVLRLPRVFTR
ncbi:hypothetical protein BH23CHL2_BH23CHL2_06800 [soil metagenome]